MIICSKNNKGKQIKKQSKPIDKLYSNTVILDI